MPSFSDPLGAALRPVESARLSDAIAGQIIAAIRDGVLKAGDRLPTEYELSQRFGVGRTSVREGLQHLRTLGIIETRKGLGAYVAETVDGTGSVKDFTRWISTSLVAIEELMEARLALEQLSAALAALRASPDQVQELGVAAAAHRSAGEARDVAGLVATDRQFHELIARSSRNEPLVRMYSVIIHEVTDFRRKTLSLPWAASRSAEGHDAIVRAIAEADPQAARQAMTEHLWVLYTEIHSAADAGPEAVLVAPREVFG
jgi:GntR family transcriptional regulator, transcriptional repressor for pyruvate dehydrogenase complex